MKRLKRARGWESTNADDEGEESEDAFVSPHQSPRFYKNSVSQARQKSNLTGSSHFKRLRNTEETNPALEIREKSGTSRKSKWEKFV